MTLEIIILILSSIITLSIGLTALLSDRKSATNRLFFLLTFFITIWSILSYISTLATAENLFLVRLTMTFVVLQNTTYGLLIMHFPEDETRKILRAEKIPLLYTTLVLLITVSPFLFTGLKGSGDNTSPVPGPGMALFLIHVVYFVIFASFKLIAKRIHTPKSKRSQLNILIMGALILFVATPFLNFILPVFSSNSVIIRYSSVLMSVFSLLIFYSIIKHRLFNVKALVAKYLSYISTFLVVIIVPVFIGFYIIDNVFSDENETIKLIAFSTLTVLIAVFFEPIRVKFNRVTNKFFYKEGYDPQILIDDFNNTLVNTIEIEELLTKSALIIQENFKTTFCTFYIRETSYFSERIIGAHRKYPEIEGLPKLQEIALKLKKKVYLINYISRSSEEKELGKIMEDNEIEVLARIVSTLDYSVKGIGYLFLGPKKSGSQYSKQDAKVIEIIANELVIAIQNALRFEEIEQFNVTLQKKIDEATKELKQSNEKLRALDEAKDEFVSMASHQLRTPLTSIKGYISMVLEGDAGKVNETQKEMLGQAYFSSQRMVYLISDLLNVSRLKTGKFNIEAKPVYLPDLVNSEIEQLYEGAKAKNLTLSFHKPDKFPTLNLDEMKIRQVVMNFTDNAIYYTPAGGKITVELKETAKSVEFTVKDSGIGVPKDQQHKLFVKFYRADNARKSRPDGTGLGLFMAKKVIIAQGGSMIFESKEGKGSVFGFSFPKEKLEVDTKQQN
jgi:signal transduction histidine kinase